MSKIRTAIWLTPILVIIGVIFVALPGMWMYMSITAETLHPNPQTAPAVTQTPPPPTWKDAVEQSRSVVRSALTEQNLPGLSVAVGMGADLVWTEGFGFADLDKREPVTPNHRFRIGTASTVLTSAAVGRALEKGWLNLDEPIQKYVPAFPPKQQPVTLRQLMGHTAGLKNDGGDESVLYGQRCEQPVDALRHFADSALLFDPGTKFRYSNYGWIVVSAAVEAVAGEPFLSFMRGQIFEPLGMTHTVAESAPAPLPERASSYFPRFAAKPTYGLHPMREVDYSCYAGAAGFLSTPSDLARFGMAMNAGKFLQRSTVQLLQTPQKLPSTEDTGYGLGWDIETVALRGQPVTLAGHDGDVLGGVVATLATFPENGMVVAVTSNISYADTFAIAVKIAEAFAAQGNAPASKSGSR